MDAPWRATYVVLSLAASARGGSPNIGRRRCGRHTKSPVEHFGAFYRSVQCESTHRNCELIEEADLSNYHWPCRSPLLQEADFRLPFGEDVISGLAGGHKPEIRIGEFDRHGRTTDPEE